MLTTVSRGATVQLSEAWGFHSEITISLTPVMVHGGFRLMDVTEFRNESEDIETRDEWVEESEILYPTEVEAELAIQGMRR